MYHDFLEQGKAAAWRLNIFLGYLQLITSFHIVCVLNYAARGIKTFTAA